jgi:2'-5' RNA ligase
VPFPSDAEAAIADVVERVRAHGVPAGSRDVRWVRLDSLHITLRFIGPTPEAAIAGAVAATQAAADTVAPFQLAVGRAGAFPSAARPRALWLDVRTGEAPLAALARTVDHELVRAGWSFGDKPFRGHLTLARADGVAAGATVAARLKSEAADLDVRFDVHEIGLFESLTGGGPARYEPLTIARLGGAVTT